MRTSCECDGVGLLLTPQRTFPPRVLMSAHQCGADLALGAATNAINPISCHWKDVPSVLPDDTGGRFSPCALAIHGGAGAAV
jgi:hypothetical protein